MHKSILFILLCGFQSLLFAQTPTIAISPLNPSVCIGSAITLTANTNATPGATFLWMPGGFTTQSITVSPSASTTYTCTVTSGAFSNSSNCAVTVNPLPTATMVVNGLTLSINSTSPLTYLWPNGTVAQSVTAFQTGQICCWISDFSGCNNTICVDFIDPTMVYSIAGQDATINCNQNSNGYQMNNNSVSGHTYSWSPSTGLSNPSIANPIANPLLTTTYTLTDFDANGNTIVDNVTISVDNTHPTLDAGQDQTVCLGQSVTLNASSNASNVTWGQIIDNGVPFVPSMAGVQTYYATAIGNNGCMTQDSVTVTVNPIPVSSVISQIDSFLYVPALLNETYQWINCQDNSLINGANSNIYFPANDGSYAVIANNGACADTSTCFSYSTMGIKENNTAQMLAFPNPSNGQFTLSINEQQIGKTLKVYSLEGVLIQQQVLQKLQNEIQIEAFAQGAYLLKIDGLNPVQIYKH